MKPPTLRDALPASLVRRAAVGLIVATPFVALTFAFLVHGSLAKAKGGGSAFAGVDVSSGSTNVSDWKGLIAKDKVRFVIADGWGGHGSFDANANIAAAMQAGAPASRIAGYCLLNFDNGATTIPGAPVGDNQNGALQVQQAFDAVGGHTLAFMAVDAEAYNFPQRLSQDNSTQRIADAVQAVRARGVPAIIYTSRNSWLTLTNGTREIQGVPLWDARYAQSGGNQTKEELAKLASDLDGPWAPYGSWTGRTGKQYADQDSPTAQVFLHDSGISTDLDIFAPSAFRLPRPAAGCYPSLNIRVVTSRSGANVNIAGVLSDDATSGAPISDALATRITSAAVRTAEAVTIHSPTVLPLRLGTIPAGKNAAFALSFPVPTTMTGTHAILDVKGAFGGGQFDSALKVTLP